MSRTVLTITEWQQPQLVPLGRLPAETSPGPRRAHGEGGPRSDQPTRRNMLATIATGAVGASVVATGSLAPVALARGRAAADAPLLRLWDEYLGHVRAHA